MATRTVTVDVDVDLDDFDDDQISDEYESRGLGGRDFHESVTEMFYAFYLGKTDHAIGLAKKLAQDVTGRALV